MDRPSTAHLLGAERERTVAGLEDLRRELVALAESTAEGPDDEHDAEGSTVGYERARVAGLLARAETRLAALDAALARVANGTYRTCTRCGGPIADQRLASLPETQVCVTCAARGGALPSDRRQF